MANDNALLRTLDTIFTNVNSATGATEKPRFQLPKKSHVKKQELELALTVLLVDLASCDQNFEPQEYQIIMNGLRRMFGTTREEVQALVNQANLVLKNLRGTARFAAMLKENMNEEERKAIMEIIEDIINADGVEDGFEVYLRHKVSDLLGVPLPQKPKE